MRNTEVGKWQIDPIKWICKASNVVGMEVDSVKVKSERQMMSKIRTMLDNTSHSLLDVLTSHRSTFGERLRLPIMHH